MQEGSNYLDRNLTEWKKPYLMPPGEEEEEEAPASKPKLSKHTTMKGTAKVTANHVSMYSVTQVGQLRPIMMEFDIPGLYHYM